VTTPAHAHRTLFVTIPVADVARSRDFFAKLGFEFDPNFSGEGTAACMVVDEHARIMLGSHESFAQYSHRPMADPATHALALFSFSVESRDDVDWVAEAALASGGAEADGPEEHGFMYTRSFFDLDGHGWQVMWMDPAAAQPGTEDDVENRRAASLTE
jgi:predicted lactoylglutathione lyase